MMGGLQWGRNLFVAECNCWVYAKLVQYVASMGPQLVRCGMSIPSRVSGSMFCASMGPQLVRCGMKIVGNSTLDYYRTLQWGRNLFVAECPPGVCQDRDFRPLQWGRNLFVAEWVSAPINAMKTRPASMGPQLVRCGMQRPIGKRLDELLLQWGRNLFVAECAGHDAADYVRLCFNGAATCSLRNARRQHNNREFGSIASMGPQLVRCGMGDMDAIIKAAKKLQWGRNLFVAECYTVQGWASYIALASMGPQLVRCGMRTLTSDEVRLMTASMGPQLVRCGMHHFQIP